jgi:hypothetical protein
MKGLKTKMYVVLVLALFAFTTAKAQIFEDVIVHENLYSQSGNNSFYRCTTYNLFTTDMNYLDTIMVADDIDFLNVYYNDGSDKRYNLHGVAGKSLKSIFLGNNTENQVVDLNELRDNYNEWFVREDSSMILINLNVVARHNFVANEKVKITDSLHNDNSQGTQYLSTAYYVTSFADMSILDTIVIDNSKDWLNVYIKNTTGTGAPYVRRDIHNVSGWSLKAILLANNLTIDSLYYGYKEWFKDASGSKKLVKLNIKAIEELGTVPVSIYPDLYANGAHDLYEMTAYKVKTSATMNDLANITILAADVDFVSIYKDKLIGYERINVTITQDTTLKEILVNNNIAIADLKDNYYEWFSKQNGDITLLNINIKAVKDIGNLPAVTRRDSLFSSGTYEYRNVAYYANSNATLNDIGAYYVNGDAGLNVYLTASDGSDSTLNISGTAGKNLKQVFQTNNIAISQLRTDYVEWFKDAYGKSTLVKLNIKEKYTLPAANKIKVTKNLFSRRKAYLLKNVSYFVKTSASLADLDTKIIPLDNDWIDVYCTVNGVDTAYKLTGVAGKTLKKALMASGNNEGINIDFNDLKKNNVEWYKNNENEWVLIKTNIKANTIYSTQSIYEQNAETTLLSVYPNPVQNTLNIKLEGHANYEYSIYSANGKLIKVGKSNNEIANIDVSDLPKGVYVLQVESDNKVYLSKFIK